MCHCRRINQIYYILLFSIFYTAISAKEFFKIKNNGAVWTSFVNRVPIFFAINKERERGREIMKDNV